MGGAKERVMGAAERKGESRFRDGPHDRSLLHEEGSLGGSRWTWRRCKDSRLKSSVQSKNKLMGRKGVQVRMWDPVVKDFRC